MGALAGLEQREDVFKVELLTTHCTLEIGGDDFSVSGR